MPAARKAAAVPGSETARDSIVSAFSADVGTFDPYVMSQTQELELARNLFDSLTWLVIGESEPTMRIAQDCTVSEDGLEYLFTLRTTFISTTATN